MKQINLSPSFLSTVYSKGYDYAVAQKLGMIPRLPTEAMQKGKLLHALMSEKLGKQSDKWVVSPYENFKTKEARVWRDSQPDNVIIAKQELVDQLNIVADRAINHPKIEHLLVGAEPEVVVEKQVNGFNVKGILDVLSSVNGKTVIDWKFMSSKNFDNFTKEALYSNYDLQGAVYDFLVDATHVYFVAIENEAPYRIKAFYCDQSFLESGADKFNKAFTMLRKENWREPNFDIQEVGDLVSWNNYNG